MDESILTILDNIHTKGDTKIFCNYLRETDYCCCVECEKCVFKIHNSLGEFLYKNANKGD